MTIQKCRSCGIEFEVQPECWGGGLFHPVTRRRAQKNYYGGYVCSETCDYRAAAAVERGMPGDDGLGRVMPHVGRSIEEKWA